MITQLSEETDTLAVVEFLFKKSHYLHRYTENLQSVASLDVISTCVMQIGMITQKSVGRPRYF